MCPFSTNKSMVMCHTEESDALKATMTFNLLRVECIKSIGFHLMYVNCALYIMHASCFFFWAQLRPCLFPSDQLQPGHASNALKFS